MLADDEREERQAQRVGLALQDAELVLADVGVLRRVDDVAAVGELCAEGVVVLRLHLRVDHVRRPAFEPVLADDHGPFLPGLRSFGRSRMP